MSYPKHQLDDLDWVSVEHQAELPRMFNELKLAIEKDVQKRNEQLQGEHFKFNDFGDDHVSVFHHSGASVRFRQTRHELQVFDGEGELQFAATTRVNGFGFRRFVVEDVEFMSWEIRQKALRRLFFG